jgi:hypothetical protein
VTRRLFVLVAALGLTGVVTFDTVNAEGHTTQQRASEDNAPLGFGVFAQQAPSRLDLDEAVRVYCAAWGERDVDRRRQTLERVFDANGTYTDPTGHAESRTALIERITAHLQKRPGTQILCSFADLHHGMLRFTWKMVGADGKTLIEGIDFGEVAADGKLKKIVGFFGQSKPRP